MPQSCKISIVVISHNEGKYLGKTIESLLASLPPDAEIVVVDDWSTDGSTHGLPVDDIVRVLRPPRRLGTVRARNFGAFHARGYLIVFSDAHVDVSERWTDMLAPLVRPTTGAVGPVISMLDRRDAKGYGLRYKDAALNCEWGGWRSADPYPVPMLGAGFFAMRRDVFFGIGGFDPGMIRYGMEDPDLDIRLWTFGYRCLLVPSVEVAHLFRDDHAFQDWETFLHNMVRYATVHFSEQRMNRLLECYAEDECLPAALARVGASDAQARRRAIQGMRCYDDDWYFTKFGMNA